MMAAGILLLVPGRAAFQLISLVPEVLGGYPSGETTSYTFFLRQTSTLNGICMGK